MLQGVIVSLAEAAIVSLFVLEVLPSLPFYILLPVLNLALTTFYLFNNKAPSSVCNGRTVAKLFCTFFTISLTCAVAVLAWHELEIVWQTAMLVLVCPAMLSMLWTQKLQTYIRKSRDGTFRGRKRVDFIYSFVKLISVAGITLSFSVTKVSLYEEEFLVNETSNATTAVSRLLDGFNQIDVAEIYVPILVLVLCAIAVHILAYTAAATCNPTAGLTVPSILACPLSTAIGMLTCASNTNVCLENILPTTSTELVWVAFTLAVLIWISSVVVRARCHLKPHSEFLAPYEELFIQPSFNPIFLEQHLILNYDPKRLESYTPQNEKKRETRPRIFMCTTMYQEAPFEMKRLLSSLHEIDQSDLSETVDLESHIFMDNGVSHTHITGFASQLLSLLETTLCVKVQDTVAMEGPYGVQYQWILPGGMPFYLHLKVDNPNSQQIF